MSAQHNYNECIHINFLGTGVNRITDERSRNLLQSKDWRRFCKTDKTVWNFGLKKFRLPPLQVMVLQRIHHFTKLAPQNREK